MAWFLDQGWARFVRIAVVEGPSAFKDSVLSDVLRGHRNPLPGGGQRHL